MSEPTDSRRQAPVHTLPALVAAIICGLAGWAGFSWQVEDLVGQLGGTYGFYMLVRVITFASALVLCYVGIRAKSVTTVWGFGLVAVLFNPIAEIGLGKDLWRWVDLGACIAFLFTLRPLIPEWFIRHFQSNGTLAKDGKTPRTPSEASNRNMINSLAVLAVVATVIVAWPRAVEPVLTTDTRSTNSYTSSGSQSTSQSTSSLPATNSTDTPAGYEDLIPSNASTGGDLFPETAISELSSSEIVKLTDDDLQYALTELVIRHGYDPKRSEVRELFEKKRGADFKPVHGRTLSEAEGLMSGTETLNYNHLAAEREKRKRMGIWSGPN